MAESFRCLKKKLKKKKQFEMDEEVKDAQITLEMFPLSNMFLSSCSNEERTQKMQVQGKWTLQNKYCFLLL